MSSRLPEVREADATPEVRALYDAIKQATGIPQVNLIFRHLALSSNVLAWAWDMIEPLYRDGTITNEITCLKPDISGADHPPIWESLDPADEAGIAQLKGVLAFYNRGNPSNLIGLTTLVRAATAQTQQPETSVTADATPEPAPHRTSTQSSNGTAPAQNTADIPPLPKPDEIDPKTWALVQDLAQRQGGVDLGVTPSLYVHISLWPAAVRQAHAIARPLLDAPDWKGRVDDIVAQADRLAQAHVGSVRMSRPPPSDDEIRPYMETISKFVKKIIPEMVIMGPILAGAGRRIAT